ncbi:MAG: 4Fe-4S cluster-binding domain-containing protein [Thermoguttaceae bacterium]|nr:4Fe-4S cluster-binding domain-containing protein [Thermoguttaceae bacterium]
MRTKICCLILTDACNLNCVYCYEGRKSKRKMDLATACEIVEREFDAVERSDEFDSLRVEFFGGEPFLEFELLRQIVAWTTSAPRPVPYSFFVTTNGTLLTPEIKKWLDARKELVNVGLSYDGTPEMQDVNRSNSSKDVDLEFFQTRYPRQTIKMTVSKQTLPSFAEGVVYLTERGFLVNPSCACGEDWEETDFDEFRRQLALLGKYFGERPELEPIELLEVPFYRILEPRTKQACCGAGVGFVAYDAAGEKFPCHLFAPVVLDGGAALSEETFRRETSEPDRRCENCLVFNVCPTCVGYNFGATGELNRRDRATCELFQRRCEVAAWFKTQRFERKKTKGETFRVEEIDDMRGTILYYKNRERLGFQTDDVKERKNNG